MSILLQSSSVRRKNNAQRCKRRKKTRGVKCFIIISLLWQMAGQVSIFVAWGAMFEKKREIWTLSFDQPKKLGIWFITADNQTKPIGFYEPTVKPQTAVASSFMTDLILLLLLVAADHITFIVSASAMSSNYLVILLHSVMRQLIFYSYTHSHRLISTGKI